MTGGRQRLKPWQALVALAVGTASAGAPTPAVPLAAEDAAQPARVDDQDQGCAEALVVEAVLRISAAPRTSEGGVVKS